MSYFQSRESDLSMSKRRENNNFHQGDQLIDHTFYEFETSWVVDIGNVMVEFLSSGEELNLVTFEAPNQEQKAFMKLVSKYCWFKKNARYESWVRFQRVFLKNKFVIWPQHDFVEKSDAFYDRHYKKYRNMPDWHKYDDDIPF